MGTNYVIEVSQGFLAGATLNAAFVLGVKMGMTTGLFGIVFRYLKSLSGRDAQI